jgi:transposase
MVQSGVVIGPERRRRFSEAQKFELLTQAFGAGGNVAEVARRAEICTSLLYRWRQSHMAASAPAFVPAVITEASGASPRSAVCEPALIVELPSGARVQINSSAPKALVEAALRSLR